MKWPLSSSVHIFDVSKMTLNYSSIFPRRVENVHGASPKCATIIIQCYFRRVMQIFDELKITLKSLRIENHTPRFHLFNQGIKPYIL